MFYYHLATRFLSFFFFNDTATTEIYTLSLHDALPICPESSRLGTGCKARRATERSSPWPTFARSEEHTSELHHSQISYAVFCLKKKKKKINQKQNHEAYMDEMQHTMTNIILQSRVNTP